MLRAKVSYLIFIAFVILALGIIISCERKSELSENVKVIENSIIPDINQEIEGLKRDIEKCYFNNKIRYQTEFTISQKIAKLNPSEINNEKELFKINSKLNSLCIKYFAESYTDQDYANWYMDENVSNFVPSAEGNLLLNQLVLLYKKRNILFVVHLNVCTSDSDYHLKNK